MRHVLTAALVAALAVSPLLAQAPIKPINLDKINTAKDEDEPHAVVDAKGFGVMYYTLGGELYSARRDPNGWHPGTQYKDIPHGGDVRSVFVHFHKPNANYPQTLFYATNYDGEKRDGRGNNFDLYFLVRNGSGGPDFTVPAPVLAVCTPADEMHPWVTADGKLYFSRKTTEGWRVFVSKRAKPDQPFEKPVQVELPVGFHHATQTPDAHTMYLQGPLANNRWGLFRSTALSGGRWSAPEELKELNSPDAPTGDRSPNLSRNGAYLYFASDRPGGKGGLDLWYVNTAELGKKR
ncbi:MAG: hypothetical protein ACJ8F7_07490 [Gemmataceae bacterium]